MTMNVFGPFIRAIEAIRSRGYCQAALAASLLLGAKGESKYGSCKPGNQPFVIWTVERLTIILEVFVDKGGLNLRNEWCSFLTNAFVFESKILFLVQNHRAADMEEKRRSAKLLVFFNGSP